MLLAMVDGSVGISEYRSNGAGSRAWLMVDSAGGVTAIDLPAAFDVKRPAPGVVCDELDRE